MLTCQQVLEFLMAYLDGELLPEVRSEFERHLAACQACVDYLNSYRRTIELERQAFEPCEAEAARAIPEDLIRAILASRKT